jgi:hypothetical protein
MACELDCNTCPFETKQNCGMWKLDAFAHPGKANSAEAVIHTQTKNQLHTRIDAKSMSRRLTGSSAGGFGGGVPPAIEMDPALYTIDNLKVERSSNK